MLSRTASDNYLALVRPEERPWGFMVHGLGWIPVWGFVLNCVLWLFFKNRSRQMVFHIQQAIQFHIYLLLPVLAWIVVSIFLNILGNLNAGLAGGLHLINNTLLSIVLTFCAGLAIWGGGMVYAGRPFLYPLFGRQVLEGSIRKISEG